MCLTAILSLGACTWDWDRFDLRPTGAPGSYHVTFEDECNGTSVDRSKWGTEFVSYDTTTAFRRYSWSGEWVADENVTVANGLCTITIENKPQGGALYTSGTLNSINKFDQRFGYFEVRAKVPRGVGFRSRAYLTIPTQWPPETDFLSVDGAATTTVGAALAWHDDQTNATATEDASYAAPDLSAAFHIYGLQWSPDALVYYLDGHTQATITRGVQTMTSAMRLELVTHVAANGEGPDATTPWPAYFQIDWVRAYAADGP